MSNEGESFEFDIECETFLTKQEYEFESIKPPKLSDWYCCLLGDETNDNALIYTPQKGAEPNWFHRKMQHMFLGIKWHKKNKD